MQEVLNSKEKLDNQLKIMQNKMNIDEYNTLLQIASHFYTKFEEYIYQESQKELNGEQIQDILNSIENVFEFTKTYSEVMFDFSHYLGIPFSFPPNFLSTSESIFSRYRNKDAKLFKVEFNERNIPIKGFMKKLPLQTKNIDFLSIALGIIFLILSLLVIFIIEINDGMKYFIIRVLIATGIALLLSGLGKSLIEVKLKMKRIKIIAYSAVAIFIILYFFNPAKPPEYKRKSEVETKIEREN